MNDVILSTKKTNGTFVKLKLITGILDIVVGIFLFNYYTEIVGDLSPFEDAGSLAFMWVGALLTIAYGIYQLYDAFLGATSYIEIYDDVIKGLAIQNFHCMEISIKMSDLNNITISGQCIYLHTNSGKYKIVSNFETTKKVMEYYESIR